MAKILIYDLKTEGHHIEYLHHLYQGALLSFRAKSRNLLKSQTKEDFSTPLRFGRNDKYVFAVGKDFEERSVDFQWNKAENIRFVYLENKEGDGNVLKKSWRMNRQLRKVVKEVNPDKIFLNTLMNFMPFLPYSVGKNKVSGIIYSIYLHDSESASALNKLSNRLKYRLLSKKKSI